MSEKKALSNQMLIATKSSRFNISEEKKTKSIARIFAKNIKAEDILFFKGELGVGKTTFIRYLVNFLQMNSVHDRLKRN